MSDIDKKEASQIFTISKENQEASTEVPDIAELLGKKKEPLKKNKPVIQEKTKTAVIPLMKSLAEFGSLWEIVFEKKDDGYYFLQHHFFSDVPQPGSNEIFQKMKFPLSYVKDLSNMNEFTRAEKNFLFDALGIQDREFLQIVMTHDQKFLNVYASQKSMKMKKDEVTDFVVGRNTEMLKSFMNNKVA